MENEQVVLSLLTQRFELQASDIRSLAEAADLPFEVALELLNLALVQHTEVDRHGTKANFKRDVVRTLEAVASSAQGST